MARRFPAVRPALRQGQRRESIWIGVSSSTTLPASAKVLISLLNATALATRPFTIVRTRLWLHVETDQSAASETVRGAFGVIVVSDQAVAAGAASVPGPVTNTDADFLVYQPFVNIFTLGDATGFVEPTGTSVMIDSKAMRKVGANEDVAYMMENAVAFGAILTLQGRYLIKLH